MKQQPVAAYG